MPTAGVSCNVTQVPENDVLVNRSLGCRIIEQGSCRDVYLLAALRTCVQVHDDRAIPLKPAYLLVRFLVMPQSFLLAHSDTRTSL